MEAEKKESDPTRPIIREVADHFEVRVKYPYPEPLQAVFSNHSMIQHDEHEFVISFYQVFQPSGIEGPESVRKQVEEAGGAPARCVSRVVISRDRMPGVVEAFSKNLEMFRKRFEKPADSSEAEKHD